VRPQALLVIDRPMKKKKKIKSKETENKRIYKHTKIRNTSFFDNFSDKIFLTEIKLQNILCLFYISDTRN